MNASGGKPTVEVNGRSYAWPDAPVVVVCIDGSEPDYEGSDSGGYIERAVAAGQMPYLGEALETGTGAWPTASCRALPTPTTSPS